jgi:PST family polysaccharide transporter
LGDGTTSPVLRALSYLILLNALSLIPLSLLRKELQFGPIGMAQIVSQLVYGVVAIAFAYWGYGFWSIVYANLLNTLTSTILYWVKCPGSDWWRPKLWDWNIVHSLFRYGMKTTANGMISYLHMHIDDWFVGRVLGSQPLGFYSQAYGFSNSTIANLGKNVIANVFFPSYAKIQNDKERLSRAYLKSVNLVLLIMTPMALGLLVASPEIVSVILGNKWLPMIPTLQVFGLLILTGPVSENAAPLFQAVGLPGYNVRAGIVLISVMAPLMFLLLSWGISGIATAVVVAHTVAVSYNIYQMNTILPGTARKTFVIALPILLAGLLMLGGVYWVKPYVLHLTSGQENLWSLLTMIGVGGIIYGSVSLFTQRALMREVSNIVLSALLLKRRAQQAA